MCWSFSRFLLCLGVFVLITGLESCDLMADLWVQDEDWTVSTEGMRTKNDVFQKTSKIRYLYSERWPTPPQVERSMTGDCKGYAILAIQLLKQLGYQNLRFVVCRETQGGITFDHALIAVDGVAYEPASPIGAIDADAVEIREEWTYEQLRHAIRLERFQGRSVDEPPSAVDLHRYHFEAHPAPDR